MRLEQRIWKEFNKIVQCSGYIGFLKLFIVVSGRKRKNILLLIYHNWQCACVQCVIWMKIHENLNVNILEIVVDKSKQIYFFRATIFLSVAKN